MKKADMWIVMVCSIILVFLVSLLVLLFRFESRINYLQDRLWLTQALMPGRGEEAVYAMMGKPNTTMENHVIAGVSYSRVLKYSSSPRKPQGNDDIWIAIEGGLVAAVYYPDRPLERRLVDNSYQSHQMRNE